MTDNKTIRHALYFLADKSHTYSALLHMINNADNNQNTSIPQAFKKYLNKITFTNDFDAQINLNHFTPNAELDYDTITKTGAFGAIELVEDWQEDSEDDIPDENSTTPDLTFIDYSRPIDVINAANAIRLHMAISNVFNKINENRKEYLDPYAHLNNLEFIKDINDVDPAIRPFTLTKENKKLITNTVYALMPNLKNQ